MARDGFPGAVPGTRRYVERYTEDVVIMFHRVADGAGQYGELVAQLQSTLVGDSQMGLCASASFHQMEGRNCMAEPGSI